MIYYYSMQLTFKMFHNTVDRYIHSVALLLDDGVVCCAAALASVVVLLLLLMFG